MTPEHPSSTPAMAPDSALEQADRYHEIGQRLLAERESQGLSQADVARALHLPSRLLEDLEQGRMERLAPLYRRGYVSNYARLLGLDESELLAGLDQDEPPRLTEVLPVRRPRFRFDRYMKLATYLIVTIAIVPPLVMIYLNTGASLFDRGERTVTEGADRSLSLDLSADASAPNSSGLAADGKENARPVSASALPLNAIRSRRPEDDAQGATEEPQVDVPAVTPIDPVVFELTVRLREDSWIEISGADDQRLEYDLLRSGQSRSYRGEPPFQVLIGRSNAVELLLNGELLTFEGQDRGDVVELVIDQDGSVRR